MNGLKFELREEHIKLLTHAYVDWQDCETGAPEIDPKRPYGNSSVAYDVAEILGLSAPENNSDYDNLLSLHRETDRALEIILRTRSFEPGFYRTSSSYTRDWQRVDQ